MKNCKLELQKFQQAFGLRFKPFVIQEQTGVVLLFGSRGTRCLLFLKFYFMLKLQSAHRNRNKRDHMMFSFYCLTCVLDVFVFTPQLSEEECHWTQTGLTAQLCKEKLGGN